MNTITEHNRFELDALLTAPTNEPTRGEALELCDLTIDLEALPPLIWHGCQFTNVRWRGATAQPITLIDCDLTACAFDHTTLHHLRLIDCRLNNCSLRGATLHNALWLRCDLTACDLRSATLNRSHWLGGTVTNSALDYLQVAESTVEHVDLTHDANQLSCSNWQHTLLLNTRWCNDAGHSHAIQLLHCTTLEIAPPQPAPIETKPASTTLTAAPAPSKSASPTAEASPQEAPATTHEKNASPTSPPRPTRGNGRFSLVELP